MIKRFLQQFSNENSLVLAVVLIVAIAITFGVFMYWFVSAVHSWATGIENPIERGLAYVAIAIVAHAFLSSSSPETKKAEPKAGP